MSAYRRSTSISSQRSGSSIYRRQISRDFSGSARLGSVRRQNLRGITPPSDAMDESEATPPPLETMNQIKGYEKTTFSLVDVPPPPTHSHIIDEEEPTRTPLPSSTEISENEARQALLKHASRRCCYGKGVAKDMSIIKIDHMCAFHYSLETFSEKRQICWAFEPYLGGPVDGSTSRLPPNVWDIEANPSAKFQNQVSQMEIPNTSSIRMCHTCGGVGRKRCFACNGNGWESCFSCHGDGHKPSFSNGGERERCWKCQGSGRLRCYKCNGDGITQCRSCTGTGQVRCFIRLVITWSNHFDDFIVDKASASVPDDQIKLVSGELVFDEEQNRLWPINHFPDNTINIASAQLVKMHSDTYFSSEKLLLQRQRVRLIPIATIHYLWKGNSAFYSVYGYEKRVHAPDYPQTCCCGCNIL